MKVTDVAIADIPEWGGIFLVTIVYVDSQCMAIAFEFAIIGLILRHSHHRGYGEVGCHNDIHEATVLLHLLSEHLPVGSIAQY